MLPFITRTAKAFFTGKEHRKIVLHMLQMLFKGILFWIELMKHTKFVVHSIIQSHLLLQFFQFRGFSRQLFLLFWGYIKDSGIF